MRVRIVPFVLAVIAAGCGATPEHAETHERHPCDPFTEEHVIDVPGEQTLDATCGDGRVGEYLVACLERCHGGCGQERGCATECTRADEACDGAELGGRTCASLGYGGGTLACREGCAQHDLSGCSPCTGPGCRELAIASPLTPASDVRLVARGRAVRAFWSVEIDGDPHVVSAAIGPGPSLADPIDLGLEPTLDVVATSTSWITLVAEDDQLLIVTLDARGNVTRGPLGLPAMFNGLELLAVPSLDGALVSAGEHGSSPTHLVLLDRRGAIVPMPRGSVHAISGRDRIAIAPVPATPTELAIAGADSTALEPRPGDRLVAWIHVADSCAGGNWCWGGAALLRDGSVILPHAGASGLEPPALVVTIGGEPRISFAPGADTIDRARFEVPEAIAAEQAPFAPIVPTESIVRAGDVRAALFDPDAEGPEPVRFVLGRSAAGIAR